MQELFTRKRMIQKISIALIVGYCFFAVSLSKGKFSGENRRLSGDMDCTIMPTEPVSAEDKPVFIASFPGAGSRMSWKVVEALTGKPSGDEWDSNGLGKNVIAVKTHWPHPTHGHKLEWGDEIDRVILFIRNPMDVLPAFHNYIYTATMVSGEDGGAVGQIAPEASWMKWRDSNFNQQLFLWRVNVQYWLDKYAPENRVVTPYERLVDHIDGPKFTQELNQFLSPKQQNNILQEEGLTTPQLSTVRNPEDVNCIWAKIMDEEDSNLEQYVPRVEKTSSIGRALSSAENFVERSYTKEQYNQLIVIIRNLRVKYGHEKRLDNTFKMYDEAIKKARDGQNYNDLFIH